MKSPAKKQRPQPIRILGIDPGSRITGYGCVDWVGASRLQWVDDGILKLASTTGKSTIPLEKRLLDLFLGLEALVKKLNPQVLVVERVFFAKNAVSALKLGQARGISLLVGALRNLSVVEFSPTQVKLAIVGAGRADKNQVAKMVRYHLGFESLPRQKGSPSPMKKSFLSADASDALALAIAFGQGLPFVQGEGQSSAAWGSACQGTPATFLAAPDQGEKERPVKLRAPKKNLKLSDALAHRILFDQRRKN